MLVAWVAYGKRADLIVHEREPFNAETGLAALAEGPLTATDVFYVRGHGSATSRRAGNRRRQKRAATF